MALKRVFDPVRKEWVHATPEEIIRQKWIEVMIHHLGFPKELLVVERGLKLLPHLKGDVSKAPERRIDLLAYTKWKDDQLLPLLLIECKCIPLTEKALSQVMGYHHLVQSRYVAIANEDEILIAFQSDRGLQTLHFLPSYNQLVQALNS